MGGGLSTQPFSSLFSDSFVIMLKRAYANINCLSSVVCIALGFYAVFEIKTEHFVDKLTSIW